jgi:hypothetical protein
MKSHPFTPSLFGDLLAPVPRRARAVLRKPAAREAQVWADRMVAASSADDKRVCRERMMDAIRAMDSTRGARG